MPEDPIVNEVRKFRDQGAAKFGYDLRAIAEDSMKRERQSGRRVVSLVRPHRPAPQSSKTS